MAIRVIFQSLLVTDITETDVINLKQTVWAKEKYPHTYLKQSMPHLVRNI